MQGRFLQATIVAMLLLAGCLDAGNDPEAAGGDTESTTPTYIGTALFLSADGHLSAEVPEAGSISAGDFILKWTTGTGTHPLFSGPAGSTWLSPHNASVTLYLETDLPVLPATGVLPDVAVWLGSGHHLPLVASAATGPLLPGEVVSVTFDLPGPEQQPPLLIDSGLDLLVTVTMTQLDLHGVRILTGGDHASGITVDLATGPALDTVSVQTTTTPVAGMLPLFDRIIGPLPEEGLSHADHPISIGENDTFLRIEVTESGGGHTVDMDMVLLDGEGRIITWGVTPYAYERIELFGASLAPYQGETLTLRIGHHLGVLMEYTGTIEQG